MFSYLDTTQNNVSNSLVDHFNKLYIFFTLYVSKLKHISMYDISYKKYKFQNLFY